MKEKLPPELRRQLTRTMRDISNRTRWVIDVGYKGFPLCYNVEDGMYHNDRATATQFKRKQDAGLIMRSLNDGTRGRLVRMWAKK